MKTLSHAIAALTLLCSLLLPAHALNLESTIVLERYTILASGDVEFANGYLNKNGTFRVFTSYILSPIFYDSPDDFALVSGRPLMFAALFDEYKWRKLIPNWVRSKNTYAIGFGDYVIVSTKNGRDPNPVPVITDQPDNERVLAGDTAWFFMDAEPWLYCDYQWYFKGKPIPGETSSWLQVTNVTKAKAGQYHVAVTLGGKPVLSRKAMLTVVDPVKIKTQPKSQTVKAGKNVTLRVTATGTPPFTYQWYRGGNVITNATKSFYSIPKVKPIDSGVYYVRVGNGESWVWSTNAVVTVNP